MIDKAKIAAAIQALDARRVARRRGQSPIVTTPGSVTPPPAIVHPQSVIIRPLASLRQTAQRRAAGYLEVCLAAGKLDGTGQYVTFTPEAFLRIRRQFSLKTPPKIIKPCCQ